MANALWVCAKIQRRTRILKVSYHFIRLNSLASVGEKQPISVTPKERRTKEKFRNRS